MVYVILGTPSLSLGWGVCSLSRGTSTLKLEKHYWAVPSTGWVPLAIYLCNTWKGTYFNLSLSFPPPPLHHHTVPYGIQYHGVASGTSEPDWGNVEFLKIHFTEFSKTHLPNSQPRNSCHLAYCCGNGLNESSIQPLAESPGQAQSSIPLWTCPTLANIGSMWVVPEDEHNSKWAEPETASPWGFLFFVFFPQLKHG